MFDKHAPGIRIAHEIPTVAIRAVVKLSDIHGRVLFGGIGGEAASFFGKGRSPRSSNTTKWLAPSNGLKPVGVPQLLSAARRQRMVYLAVGIHAVLVLS